MSQEPSAPPNGNASKDADPASRDAMAFIFGRLNYERVPHDSYTVEDFKLARMQRLLEALGNPQVRLPAVHIAGTKGKGSTAAMLAAMLQAAGLKAALFTSPHLFEYEERMTVNGRRPSHQDIVDLVSIAKPVVEALDGVSNEPGTTFFELTTALAWLYFTQEAADVAVLEVGLGGRLDSTNLCRPLCCIITSISRDHMRLLGETLPEIAAEKAGIVKPGVPVISGVEQPDAAKVVTDVARSMQAPEYRLDRDVRFEARLHHDAGSQMPDLPRFTVDVTTPWRSHTSLPCPLPGRHQARNLACAVAAYDSLSAIWPQLSPDAIEAGLRRVDWPLRIQQVGFAPRVILDGSHNDASATVLCETIERLPCTRRVLIFGTSRDKDVRSMLSIFGRHFDLIVLTRYMKNPRALPVDQLASIAAETVACPTQTAATLDLAWKIARDQVTEDGLICVAGSLYLASEMQLLLTGAVL
jgi:dihydrofolate synthase / folylpolyglutamate synthase